MKSEDQAEMGDLGPMQLEDMRTIGALRAVAPTPDAVARLSDRALRAAALNPDHSEAGRAAAAAILRARGVTLTPWSVTVPSFLSAQDLAKGDALFFGAGRTLRRLLGALTVLALLVLVGAVLAGGFAREAILASFAAALAFGALWLLASVLRLHPARVCYVEPTAKNGAERLARELRPYGHVISYRAVQRAGSVRDAASYRGVAAALRNRFLLNARELFSDHEALSVSAVPAWRPMLTQLLARSSDALIVDLSTGAPADWDMIQPHAARCVFVSAWGRHEQAEATFAGLGLPGQCFFYAPDGEIQRRGQFRAAVLAAMRAAHAS